MSKKIRDLLEKARFELPVLSTNIPTRKLIGEALDLIGQQPPTGEFTEKLRNFVKMYEKEIPRRAEITFLKEACDIIDQLQAKLDTSEARLKVLPDLLEACKIGLSYMQAIESGVPRPILDLQEDKEKVKAVIAKAKKSGE